MQLSNKSSFFEQIAKLNEFENAKKCLENSFVAAFESEEMYGRFKTSVLEMFPNAERIAVAGTANWNFSLNPNKCFKEFGDDSDVDTIVVSNHDFMNTWELLRDYDRNRFSYVPFQEKNRLRRNGENVYAGFVSPLWIPIKRVIYEHKQILNRLSGELVNYKPVRLLFFRNWEEAIAYYSRGFLLAKRIMKK